MKDTLCRLQRLRDYVGAQKAHQLDLMDRSICYQVNSILSALISVTSALISGKMEFGFSRLTA
jgi:hypothetical protein